MQQSPAGDLERIGSLGELDAEGHILLQFLGEPIAEVAAGQVAAFAPDSGDVLMPKVISSVGSLT